MLILYHNYAQFGSKNSLFIYIYIYHLCSFSSILEHLSGSRKTLDFSQREHIGNLIR